MVSRLIEELRNESEKVEAMTPRTIRLPTELDKEVREFCGQNQIKFSVLSRRIFTEGWRAVLAASEGGDEESPR